MNDPFELRGVTLSDRNFQDHLCRSIGSIGGALCFSRNGKNPLLWTHYSCKHRGVCLGFDRSATWENEIQEPRYVDGLSLCNSEILVEAALDSQTLDPADPSQDAENMLKELLLTKFRDWSYEDEARIWLKLHEGQKDGELFFAKLDENIQPSVVILGAR